MVQGCIDNLNEWLLRHTWICWYIRDGHGRLRPLWDSERVTSLYTMEATERRWRGYSRNEHLEPESPEKAIIIHRRESPERGRSRAELEEMRRRREREERIPREEMVVIEPRRLKLTNSPSVYSSPSHYEEDYDSHEHHQAATYKCVNSFLFIQCCPTPDSTRTRACC